MPMVSGTELSCRKQFHIPHSRFQKRALVIARTLSLPKGTWQSHGGGLVLSRSLRHASHHAFGVTRDDCTGVIAPVAPSCPTKSQLRLEADLTHTPRPQASSCCLLPSTPPKEHWPLLCSLQSKLSIIPDIAKLLLTSYSIIAINLSNKASGYAPDRSSIVFRKRWKLSTH